MTELRNWGATSCEVNAALPGDDLIPDPATSATMAITINAPTHEVWRSLIQIGKDQHGLYSDHWPESAIGLDDHNIRETQARFQTLSVGDRVTLVRSGWLGIESGYSLPVAKVEHERFFVLQQSPTEHPWNAVWSFHLIDLSHNKCRLLSRSRSQHKHNSIGFLGQLAFVPMQPITFAMAQRMLRGIKECAESNAPKLSSRQRTLCPDGPKSGSVSSLPDGRLPSEKEA